MIRLRLATRPFVLFLAMVFVMLVLLLPMRVALGAIGIADAGLAARRVDGSIWSGTIVDARFGQASLGDLSARLSPWPLLIGRARLIFAGPGVAQGTAAALPIGGSATVDRHAIGIADVTATVPTGTLFAPLPVTSLTLDGLSVRFRDGLCEHADGRVVANIVGDASGVPLPAAMSGAARCDGDALLLPMTSQAGSESVMLRIDGDARYRAELTLNPTDPAVIARLQELGFVRGAGGYRLSVQGGL